MIGLSTMPLQECSMVATLGLTVLYPVLFPVVS